MVIWRLSSFDGEGFRPCCFMKPSKSSGSLKSANICYAAVLRPVAEGPEPLRPCCFIKPINSSFIFSFSVLSSTYCWFVCLATRFKCSIFWRFSSQSTSIVYSRCLTGSIYLSAPGKPNFKGAITTLCGSFFSFFLKEPTYRSKSIKCMEEREANFEPIARNKNK